MVSGLAASIRSSLESTTFDLSGHDYASIQSIITDAFQNDFPVDNFQANNNNTTNTMIRLTFLVGAGKQSRSRYDAQAARAVTSTLKNTCGYDEDHGASCIWECGGTYKLQHDTAKNLKTVVVFPRPVGGIRGEDDGDAGSGKKNKTKSSNGAEEEPLIPHNSPGYKIAVSSVSTFQNLLTTYCPTYIQKMNCKQSLEGLLQLEKSIEEKMMNGHFVLDAGEKSFYDDTTDLQEKMTLVQKEMGKHLDDGRLTVEEKKKLVKANEKRIQTLLQERKEASSPSLKATVNDWLEKAQARKEQLQSLPEDVLIMNSSYPPPLRYESQLTSLRKKVLTLQALEDSSKGRLLTLSETRALTEKGEMEEEIEHLEQASYGWFEDDDAFQERVQKSRDRFHAKYNKSKRGGGKSSSGMRSAGSSGKGSGSGTKWILPGEKPKGEKNAWGVATKKKYKGKAGAVFTAMMMDSSSEEEDDDDDDDDGEDSSSEEEEEVVIRPKKSSIQRPNNVPLSAKNNNKAPNNTNGNDNNASATPNVAPSSASPKKKSKKKKKNKSKQLGQSNNSEEEDWEVVDDETADESPVDSGNDAASADVSTVSNSLLEFWKAIIFPLIMCILDVFASLLSSFVGGKKSGKKKKH